MHKQSNKWRKLSLLAMTLTATVFLLQGCGGGGGGDGGNTTITTTASTPTTTLAKATGLGTISGTVTDSTAKALPGVKVSVRDTKISGTTDAKGAFTLSGIQPGPVFLYAAAPSNAYLDTDTKAAVFVKADASVSGVSLILSTRPEETAE
ncbi:MAG: carboxypeptidase-like regulatory domain-containing protein, partial [Proteobacteria bacterium]|nr:carboxypeptidase-like regulatory domain-containing protein [Pseudomonadota bacterium]